MESHPLEIAKDRLPGLTNAKVRLRRPTFQKLCPIEKLARLHTEIAELIEAAPTGSFLLPMLIDFFSWINEKKLVTEHIGINSFEFWLIHFSGKAEAQQQAIREKIVGKRIPRDEYQVFFPIGSHQTYRGSHFVAAHHSPDVDTMIASFFGWLDAFAARVAQALHIWSLPSAPPDSPIVDIFCRLFGKGTFDVIADASETLVIKAQDLVSGENLVKALPDTPMSVLDHGNNEKAVILVNEKGEFCGDWHSTDVERVRQVVVLYKACLHELQNTLHHRLISLFSRKILHAKHVKEMDQTVFEKQIQKTETYRELSPQLRKILDVFLQEVLHLPAGCQATYRQLIHALSKKGMPHLEHVQKEILTLTKSPLFDQKGNLIEGRTPIFRHLEGLVQNLDKAFHQARNFVERLDCALEIKEKVLKTPTTILHLQHDVEDIRNKMGNLHYLTVVVSNGEHRSHPIGVVWAQELQQLPLGTVSFRDFCNEEEVRMAPYLTAISVVDHHKATLRTRTPPLALIGDAQSSNVLIAEQTMQLNDKYSRGNLSPRAIEKQLKTLSKQKETPNRAKLQRRLLQRQMATRQGNDYAIHPQREYAEYLCFLHAILDDTDLLTKVTKRDVLCVASLLNRIVSLRKQEEVIVLSLDDIPNDRTFAHVAAQWILKNKEMYAFYREVYAAREKEVTAAIRERDPSRLFLDTKELNGCCRVGQTKIFSTNVPVLKRRGPRLRDTWCADAAHRNRQEPQLSLFLHMISTLPNAEEVHEGKEEPYTHRDALWIWIPQTGVGYNRLTSFLNAFQHAPEVENNTLSLEVYGTHGKKIEKVFRQNFLPIPVTRLKGESSYAILHFDAGSLNSRKAMIAPYLPTL